MLEHNPSTSNGEQSLETFDYSPDHFRSAVIKIMQPEALDKIKPYAGGASFLAKDEFHITVFPNELFERLDDDQRKDLAARLESAYSQHPDIEFDDTVYRIKKNKCVEEDGETVEYERESLVIPLHGSCSLAKAIANAYADAGFAESDMPFLHVTLFTRPTTDIAKRGIGIANYEVWAALKPQIFHKIS